MSEGLSLLVRHDELRRNCQEFHKEHPEVWRMFVEFAFDRIERGFQHYSADAIFHRIRWEMAQPTYEKGEEFKLNDHYTAFYARAFMKRYPKHDGFFRTRTQKSKDEPPTLRRGIPPRYLDSVA